MAAKRRKRRKWVKPDFGAVEDLMGGRDAPGGE